MRSTLLRLADHDHVLCFTLHHVVSDGWSMDVLVREVSGLYGAFARDEEPRLPELPVQYADYAVWQRAWLSGEVLEEQIGFWREQLAGAPPLLEIPTDRPRSAAPGARGGSHELVLPPGVSRGLRALSRREGTTLFMTLLAGWQALLSKYSGQEDVVVGSPIAGRTRREVEGLIGFFVNLLALRVDLSGDPAWTGLLGRVRGAALEAYEHQDLPFERLVEELGVERSLTHAPVFQVVFALSRAGEGGGLRLGGLALEPFGAEEGTTRFDLNLTLRDGDEGLAGALVYRAELFEAETIARMAGHLEVLLEAMAAEPGRRLSEVSLLRGAERVQVLEAWNATRAGYPRELVHELFAGQAARTPDAPAVLFRDEVLSYAELERRSRTLAHRLRSLGIGPEARVGLCLERGPETVVAVLSVLRAGGAYVPMDPAYPPERLGRMLADAGASVLLTQTALLDGLPAFEGEVLCLDAQRERSAGASGRPLPADASPQNAAYVIYTSGSTGTPKGVVVEHGSLANYLHFFAREVLRDEGFALPLVSRLSFDAHVRQLFPPLLRGEAVWVLEEAAATDPGALLEALGSRERVSFGGVPSLWSAVLEQVERGQGRAPEGLVAVLLGGEAVAPELVRRTRARFPGAAVWNHYGPTEATVNTTAGRVHGGERITLGRAIANVRTYVCGAGGQPQPVGVPGELWIGGAGVARGYLGRPELTAERFVPDPFGREPGARLYRSGDRVRRLPSGELEYLGRVDAQVKVRGFRIEPGEIEAVLLERNGVREAVVTVREDAPGQRRLVGYVVAGGRAAVEELREHLRERLPEYMVPAALVVLERLPLSANGKIDRRALPAPERAVSEEGYAAPRTPVEEVLCSIWAEVLGVERVGVEESFFALGGHSLLATQVVSRARQAFGAEVPLRALFEASTVAGLAARIEALRGPGVAVAPPMVRVPRGGPLPLSFAQQRLWLVDRLEPGSAAYNMPYALRLRGALDVAALRASLDALVRRHETLRTTFEERDGQPVQVVRGPAPVALTAVDLRGVREAGREAARLAGEEALRPFDLARGPLLRSTLLRLGEDDHVLCFTLHHVVSDGWSRGVLVREVSALYAASTRGEEPRLPELPVQYADYAVWQRARLSGETLEAQIAYWRERLAGAPPLLEIPTDRPRATGQSPRAGSHRFALPAGVTQGLRALSRKEGATLFMTVLAGWQALLARYAGEEDVVVGSPIAGRTRVETEGLIGFFVNMLPLRADLSGDPTWAALLRRVREGALEAYAHQELPFERLVEELSVERSLAHAPLFQVTFALDRSGDHDALTLGDLVPEPFGGGAGVARFDLDLTVRDGREALAGALAYRAELFDAETIARMAGHLETLLEEMAAEPARRLSELSLLHGAERARVLEAWNDTSVEVPSAHVHEQVSAQAARTPDAVAVRSDERTLTYGELEREANRLAHALRRRGVGPEGRVGVLLERSAELIVALLGVLKAGAAYVPLEPSSPPERLGFVLEDAGVSVLLLREDTRAAQPRTRGGILSLDGDAAEIAGERDDAPTAGVGGGNAAYLIYTSGSTGWPKGVVVEHRQLSNYVHAVAARLGLHGGMRHALVSTVAADLGNTVLYPALCTGGTLHVLSRESATSAGHFVAAMRRHEIDVLKIVPSHLAALLDGTTSAEGLPRRLLVLGGETSPAGWVRELRERAPEMEVVNHYGPTETTVGVLTHRVDGSGLGWTAPLGRPLGNTRVYVLDRWGGAVPVGVVGELHVGGAQVARGYAGRPELTAERFVPDAFGGEPGARLYRTGDRARWTAAGELEFLGRTDSQVKVRGFRVEPGEIETSLRTHPAVREAVVEVRGDAPGQKRLVAYVVPAEGARAAAAELRAHLLERLPEYMVPGAFVVLDRLPLTSNGKVDRRALPAPEAEADAEQAGPRTATEEMLSGIWAEVLRVERVGVEESFFALGGHSLLATQVVSRARQAFGVEVPLRTLFEAPTVAALAERVEILRAPGAASLPPIERVPREAPLPLSFAQQRLWIVDRLEPDSSAYNMPYALRLRGALDVGRAAGRA